MASLLVVGSVALDTVETPYGRLEDGLGGSAVYFSYAASFFTRVRLVGVVGQDFPQEFVDLIGSRDVDTAGLQIVDGKTFRWSGAYEGAMNEAETKKVELNVFGDFQPEIPEAFRDSEFVFLANGSPVTQKHVVDQMTNRKFAVADTMNLWIENTRDELLELLKVVDGIVLNDGEARMLTEEANLVQAAKSIQGMGPRLVVIKKGEHGAMLVSDEALFVLPAYPVETVKDPTGAGDSFAGGMMGYLAEQEEVTEGTLKKALAYGTMCASFNVEDFSLNRFQQIGRQDIDGRLEQYLSMLRVE
ncbi:MAG: sugar kinase [Planctomycetes bacterium]|nr:sugar kinase [Planctomycetota bacterium]